LDDCKRTLGPDLIAVFAYGSAVRGEYVPGKSDINFLVVVESAEMEIFEALLKLVRKWRKKKIATPLVLSKEYILSSLDTFPIEYLEIKSCYKCLYGEDLIESLELERSNIRLQCEREIRSKLLRLRQAYLETEGDASRIKGVMIQSIPTFLVLLKTLLYLRGEAAPLRTAEILSRSVEVLGLDGTVLDGLLALKTGKSKLSKEETRSLAARYAAEMAKLVKTVDELPA